MPPSQDRPPFRALNGCDLNMRLSLEIIAIAEKLLKEVLLRYIIDEVLAAIHY